MLRMYKIIDISKDMLRAPLYPGDPPPEVSVFSAIAAGDACNMAKLTATLHTGTHADAPLHFLPDGAGIGALPLSPFIGECTVIEVPPGPLTGEAVNRLFPQVKRLLLKGGGKAYFEKTGAEEAAALGLELLGTDALSVGGEDDQKGPHRALLRENVCILENLELSKVSPGSYFLFAPPVKIGGADGAPVRALLLDGYLFWSGSGV
ncbi:MAG: cyclase family protein [Clostridia bacterium]|nr:cyclase family protein [Clostridia bacterium]